MSSQREALKVSVAVPSFNYGRFIGACLESIQRQDHSDFEVLIADGGSRDGSVQVIERYCASDTRFRLVSRSDRGQVDGITQAFSHATGNVFCFLNADDAYLCDDAFSSALALFRHYPNTDVVTFGGYYIDDRGKHLRPVRLRYHPRDDIGLMKLRSGALQPATFWRRRVAETFPFRAEYEYSFDTVFFYESFMRFSWIEDTKPVAAYRVHGENKSLQINTKRVRELARFERFKFGPYSLRGVYLELVGILVSVVSLLPVLATPLKRIIRLIVNGVAYLTAYRLPTI